ncbi:class II glutamine amidotransferase [Streptomyces mirabilis]|uniref:Class II glutamine amidotransferase n=1 Tax=Streptomyces mirabilis TaxID=68239 RepID=A0ABU3V5R2_9ACTN|nr:class II glutamine amidotransferase [Streptomyces mirabilis]MCX5355702.1 class II glutamine amidotransferase [Streptomyces mirabilis]MDU9001345.1 class II glutamine amidotransferase [Streptomyces mirabilis]
MCRLLGVVARRPVALTDLLASVLDPFLALATEHADGWGVARRTAGGSVGITKDPRPAGQDARLRPLLATTITDAALVHLRMATPGSRVANANTHPFGDHRSAFAHNGDFSPVTALDEVAGPALAEAADGDTDSERFHLAIRRRTDDGMDPVKAVLQAADDIRAHAERFASLNCLLLTQNALLAYAEHDPDSEVIARRGTDYFHLRYRRTPDAVVVASTGWPQPAPHWQRVPERGLLEVVPGTLETTVHGR